MVDEEEARQDRKMSQEQYSARNEFFNQIRDRQAEQIRIMREGSFRQFDGGITGRIYTPFDYALIMSCQWRGMDRSGYRYSGPRCIICEQPVIESAALEAAEKLREETGLKTGTMCCTCHAKNYPGKESSFRPIIYADTDSIYIIDEEVKNGNHDGRGTDDHGRDGNSRRHSL